MKHSFGPLPSVLEQNRPNLIETITLCRVTGEQAIAGLCMAHQSDDCLSLYVRYNYVAEKMQKIFKDSMVEVRRQVG